MLILVPKTTNRLHYIFDLILKDLLGISFKFTTDNETFTSYNGPKMHYGNNKFWDEPFQKATNILFEHDITEKELKIVDYKDVKAFFPVFNDKSMFPFDLFAASFYLVTRFEEYLPHINDKHNRFQAKDSILFKMNMLEKPIVNIWAKYLGAKLKEFYPNLQLKKKSFTFVPTYDVDAAWAYKNKGIFRSTAAFARDIMNMDFRECQKRWDVIIGRESDPFDTFDYQLQLQKELNLHPNYFILCGEYDFNDKNVIAMSKLIMELDPSYQWDKWRVWLSFRYQSKQYINRTNTLYFKGRWETFGGIDYEVNKHLSLSLNVINILNQKGASGSIPAADLATDVKDYQQHYLMSGTYIRPFTMELTASLKF